eukprot:TRINITY_DN3555_c0_g1_i3.p1 TRINITY_DN3555_c0_g1~~TRINITY_DN3555_c0_g1_i3.p1  ORF type:complete len:139 (+),score=7.27 TRINITY_DN3555_c0_g1_i3:113-529(+)
MQRGLVGSEMCIRDSFQCMRIENQSVQDQHYFKIENQCSEKVESLQGSDTGKTIGFSWPWESASSFLFITRYATPASKSTPAPIFEIQPNSSPKAGSAKLKVKYLYTSQKTLLDLHKSSKMELAYSMQVPKQNQQILI